VVSNFIVQALRGEDLTVFGDRRQTRSFCYVDDLIRGMMLLMDSAAGITGLPGDDPKQRQPDIAKATSMFAWKPTVSLDDGLEPTIAYFRKLQAAQALQ